MVPALHQPPGSSDSVQLQRVVLQRQLGGRGQLRFQCLSVGVAGGLSNRQLPLQALNFLGCDAQHLQPRLRSLAQAGGWVFRNIDGEVLLILLSLCCLLNSLAGGAGCLWGWPQATAAFETLPPLLGQHGLELHGVSSKAASGVGVKPVRPLLMLR